MMYVEQAAAANYSGGWTAITSPTIYRPVGPTGASAYNGRWVLGLKVMWGDHKLRFFSLSLCPSLRLRAALPWFRRFNVNRIVRLLGAVKRADHHLAVKLKIRACNYCSPIAFRLLIVTTVREFSPRYAANSAIRQTVACITAILTKITYRPMYIFRCLRCLDFASYRPTRSQIPSPTADNTQAYRKNGLQVMRGSMLWIQLFYMPI